MNTAGRFTLKFDGACKGNPGISGGGAIIYNGSAEIMRCGVYLPRATNNQAEYSGLIAGLKHAKSLGIKKIDIVGDSLLIVKQIKGQYAARSPNIVDYYKETKSLLKHFDYTITHVLRALNADADQVANDVVALRADLCVSTQSGAQEVCTACPKH